MRCELRAKTIHHYLIFTRISQVCIPLAQDSGMHAPESSHVITSLCRATLDNDKCCIQNTTVFPVINDRPPGVLPCQLNCCNSTAMRNVWPMYPCMSTTSAASASFALTDLITEMRSPVGAAIGRYKSDAAELQHTTHCSHPDTQTSRTWLVIAHSMDGICRTSQQQSSSYLHTVASYSGQDSQSHECS